ncbi:hypothetical protein [Pseudomonas tohonis]|uniref:hypothetical protein n=1 Tax=Pseudomonas tohonis TaxID=2725477 RepID=UPI001F2F78F9|nr:hypothetical protein [Pseudomonas tohonis]
MNSDISDVPSKKLDVLKRLKKGVILKAVRFGWWPAEEFVSLFKIDGDELFSFTEGALLVYLVSGDVIGFASDESLNSIVVWLELEGGADTAESVVEKEEDLFPVCHNDERYSKGIWRGVSGRVIERIFLIRRKPPSVQYDDLPNEVGLMLILDDREKLLLCHNLCDKSNVFSVCGYGDLSGDIIGELSFLEIL